jgi:hypothetical protein
MRRVAAVAGGYASGNATCGRALANQLEAGALAGARL